MSEPISDFDMNAIRDMVTRSERFDGSIECWLGTIDHADVAGLIARLVRAEAKLERIRKAIPRNQYLSLPMLVEVKEIVDG